MFTVALFTTEKIYKQPKCPSQMNGLRSCGVYYTHTHIHTKEYYSAIEKNKILLFVTIQMNPKDITLCEINQPLGWYVPIDPSLGFLNQSVER